GLRDLFAGQSYGDTAPFACRKSWFSMGFPLTACTTWAPAHAPGEIPSQTPEEDPSALEAIDLLVSSLTQPLGSPCVFFDTSTLLPSSGLARRAGTPSTGQRRKVRNSRFGLGGAGLHPAPQHAGIPHLF